MSNKYKNAIDNIQLPEKDSRNIAHNALRIGLERRKRHMQRMRAACSVSACLLICAVCISAVMNMGSYDNEKPAFTAAPAESPKAAESVTANDSAAANGNAVSGDKNESGKSDVKSEDSKSVKNADKSENTLADTPESGNNVKNAEIDMRTAITDDAADISPDISENISEDIDGGIIGDRGGKKFSEKNFSDSNAPKEETIESEPAIATGGISYVAGAGGGAASGAAEAENECEDAAGYNGYVFRNDGYIPHEWENIEGRTFNVNGKDITIKTDSKMGFLAMWNDGGVLCSVTGTEVLPDDEIINIVCGR